MNIVVCIKQVVDTNDIKWTKNNTIDREGVQSVINPCDVLALETALRLKDQNTKITVITMGPPQAKEALKTALAMGCDKAYLLSDKKFSGADTVATSRTLATAIKSIEPDFDLIICGQFASDGDTAQTGPSIAQKLNIEQITYVSEIAEINSQTKTLTALRSADENIEVVQTPLPALICVNDCPYQSSTININGYIKAQNSEIKTISAEDLNLNREEIGIKGSPTWVSKAFRATTNREKILINQDNLDNESTTDFLIRTLKNLQNEEKKEEDFLEINTNIQTNNNHFTNNILIWGQTNSEGMLIDSVFQLASKALELQQQIENCKISIITTGEKTEEYLQSLSQFGVNELITLKNDLLKEYNTKNYASAILECLKDNPATIFLISATNQGRDLAPQISSALNTGLTADCTGLEIIDNNQLAATRPTFGGELMATILCKTIPQMATIRPNVFKAIKTKTTQTPSHKIFTPNITEPSLKRIIKSYPIQKEENSLENAKIILAGGKGLKDKQTFEKLRQLAKLLNAQVGASRKAVDAGLATHEEQIGQTGKNVAPDIYVAFGISGAIQHYSGIEKAKKIIAVNTDKNAPIVQNSDITIIANAKDIINEWLEKLNK